MLTAPLALRGDEMSKWSPSDKSNQALKIAKGHFETLGFGVTNISTWASGGSGLTVVRGRECFLIEVRVASYSKGWKVKKVCQIQSDAIAIVFLESRNVHVEDMKAHIALCASSGERALGFLGRLYGSKPTAEGE